MKEFDKSNIITGAVLLVLASLFSVSLILQPFDFGVVGPGHNNFFFKLGNLIFSAYGFSSILIPIFLLLSGLSCFTSKWTFKSTLRLLSALVPFFTCVITENLCRSIIEMDDVSLTGLKVAIVIITGLMLLVIEFLGSGIIADKLIIKNRKKKGIMNEYDYDFSSEDDIEDGFDENDKDDVIAPENELNNSIDNDDAINNNENLNIENNNSENTSIFDNVVPTKIFSLEDVPSEETPDNNMESAASVSSEPKIEDKENDDNNGEEQEPIKKKQIKIEDLERRIRQEIRLDDKPILPSIDDNLNSGITQEEFESLTEPGSAEYDWEWQELALAENELKVSPEDSILDTSDDIVEVMEDGEGDNGNKDTKEALVADNSSDTLDIKKKDLDSNLGDNIDEGAEEDFDVLGDSSNLYTIEDLDNLDLSKEEVSDEEFIYEINEEKQNIENLIDEDFEDIEFPDDSDFDDISVIENEVPEPDFEEDIEPDFSILEDDFQQNEPGLKEININTDFPLDDENDFNNNDLEASNIFDLGEDISQEPYDDDIDIDNSFHDYEFDESEDYDNSDLGDFGLGLLDDNERKEESNDSDNIIDNNDGDDIEENESEEPKIQYSPDVVYNPKFPNTIVIRDNTIKQDEEEKKDKDSDKKNQVVKPKFPSKIHLDLVSDESISPKVNIVPKNNFLIRDDEFEEEDNDINLPLPKLDLNKSINLDDEAPDEKPEEELPEKNQPETDDIIIKDMEGVSDYEQKKEPKSISFNGTTVFSDMENDIRKNHEEKLDIQLYDDSDDVPDIPEDNNVSNEGSSKENNNIDSLPDKNTDTTDIAGQIKITNGNIVPDFSTDGNNEVVSNNNSNNIEKTAPASINSNRAVAKKPYSIDSNLLTKYEGDEYWVIDDGTKQDAANLKQTLSEFNIEAEVTGIKKGPVVTMFEILPAPGVRLSKIVALQDNIALSLAAQSVRIVAPIPGKQAVGIEVPNKKRSVVGFRELIELDTPEWTKMAVPVILGKDILGKAQIIDLVKTPHMLIAGATGSGKSVCVNSLILSILYKRSFRDVKLILIDPKVVELKLYNDIPHLLTPVITEPKKALKALQYCLCEMERRYALLDGMGVRDISNYNQKIKEQHICTEKLPYMVVIIDEFADLMATSGKELESIVARLTAMSRAVGIHLVLATQRPSVNVITGLIKANIPTRIAFMVASRTDSNIIIDSVGAEKLLGRGDMLYASAVDPAPVRIQGTFVSDQEVEDVVKAVKEYGEPDYLDDNIFEDDEDSKGTDLFGEVVSDDDPLYDQALEIVVQAGKASASYIQRRLKIGYNRAARLVEEMEDRGIVGPANGSKPREIIHIP